MTTRLASAMRERRHLRGKLVLCQTGGSALTQRFLDGHVRRGAPARAIQELAGHRSLNTTVRYMHLSPAAIEGAIRLLEPAQALQTFGDIVETANVETRN